MAHFENEALGVSFDLPDKITVAAQLQYKGAVFAYGASVGDVYLRYWAGVRNLVQNWQCEAMPDQMVDIETIYDAAAVNAIIWACNEAVGHMNGLGKVEKN